MQESGYMLAIDQGTTSSRAIIYDKKGNAVAVSQKEFTQHYPADGWVEHEPEDIWQTTFEVCGDVIKKASSDNIKVSAAGITNQRETTLVWDRKTGEPVYRAIVWQDRRTASYCSELKEQGKEKLIKEKCGLLLDPYFSATKIRWILENVEGAREKAEKGELAFGTVDTFLLWRLTEGKSHMTDATNASRTMLYNIHEGRWDKELLSLFDIPESILPEVKDCAADFGTATVFDYEVPVAAIAGDQHAATFGQCCFSKGAIKSTYGTGCFVVMNTGEKPVMSKNNLLTTIAYQLDGKTTYAIEGSIFISGAAVQWLRDGIKIIEKASETENLASSLASNSGVYMVPAFTGLGAPHWDPDARGAIFGITRATGIAEFVRATLEAVCYQTYDLFSAMADDGIEPKEVRVDGGMVANSWLLQFLSDILGLPVDRPVVHETTALGVAYMAGLQAGIYSSLEDIQSNWQKQTRFSPAMDDGKRNELISGWKKAVERVKTK